MSVTDVNQSSWIWMIRKCQYVLLNWGGDSKSLAMPPWNVGKGGGVIWAGLWWENRSLLAEEFRRNAVGMKYAKPHRQERKIFVHIVVQHPWSRDWALEHCWDMFEKLFVVRLFPECHNKKLGFSAKTRRVATICKQTWNTMEYRFVLDNVSNVMMWRMDCTGEELEVLGREVSFLEFQFSEVESKVRSWESE